MFLNLSAGLMVGLFSSALFFGLHALGELRTPFGGQALWAAVAFHALMLISSLWRHRSREPDIPFSRLFAGGLLISLVAASVAGLGSWIFLSWVDPSFLDWVKEQSIADLASFNLEGEEALRQRKAIESSTPGSFIIQGMMAVLMRGFLLTLPIAALVRLRSMKS